MPLAHETEDKEEAVTPALLKRAVDAWLAESDGPYHPFFNVA